MASKKLSAVTEVRFGTHLRQRIDRHAVAGGFRLLGAVGFLHLYSTSRRAVRLAADGAMLGLSWIDALARVERLAAVVGVETLCVLPNTTPTATVRED